jgi:hypothetical protein
VSDLKDIVDRIEALSREPGFIYTLALILMRDLFLDPREAADINWHEHLSFQEITFLVGLFIKRDIDFTIPSESESAARFERVYELFLELHQIHGERFRGMLTSALANKPSSPHDSGAQYRAFFGAGDMMTEPIFYGGSGAYDFQYLELAVKKYNNDSSWITKHTGIDVPLMAEAARKLKTLHESKYRDLPHIDRNNFPELCKIALSIFCFTNLDLDQQLGKNGTADFINTFSLSPGKVNEHLQLPGQYNDLQSRPIVRFPDGRYFLPIGFNLSEAIYECPFYWMNRDPAYREIALRNRGESAQDITADLLRMVFGKDNVYTEVRVEKGKGHTITDIDVLAVTGNKAVIVQIKSKRLTELARLGNDEKLVDDFKAAVQDAYDQALLSRRAVMDGSNKLFVNGRELHLAEQVDDAYILCITLDHYPAVIHQVDIYLKKTPSDPFPIALSVFDLDILCFYLKDRFEFLYYLRQRIRLNTYFRADSEMALLGFHLKNKLYKRNDADMEALDNSFAQLVDANFPVLRGSVPKTSASQKLYATWTNENFQELVKQIKSTNNAGLTDALFFLYDIAGKGADELVDAIARVKRLTDIDDRTHDASLLYTGMRAGVTILSEPRSADAIRKKLPSFALLRKYKSKADLWLGLGCLGTSHALVDAMVFYEQRWEKNDELEELVSKHFPTTGKLLTPSGRKIGRNELCPCGSGKKFKRCHGAT